VINAGRRIAYDGSTNQTRIGCNIRRLPELVNNLLAANTAGVGIIRRSTTKHTNDTKVWENFGSKFRAFRVYLFGS